MSSGKSSFLVNKRGLGSTFLLYFKWKRNFSPSQKSDCRRHSEDFYKNRPKQSRKWMIPHINCEKKPRNIIGCWLLVKLNDKDGSRWSCLRPLRPPQCEKTTTTLEVSNGSLRRFLRKRLRFADLASAIDCGLRYSQLSTILHSWPPVRTTLIIQRWRVTSLSFNIGTLNWA